MIPQRVVRTVGLAGLLLLFVLLVPLPVSRVRQVGLVQVRPEAIEQVFVQEPGILVKLHVREGEHVERGDLLAEFRNLDLENKLAEAQAAHDIHAVQLRTLREHAGATVDPHEKARINAELSRLAGERGRALREIEVYEKMLKSLDIRAPRSGVVIGLPRIDEVGKFWEKDGTTFCNIGDPAQLWVLLPLGPADYRLLKEELEATRRQGADLPVAIGIKGRAGHTWQGTVNQLPESEAAEIPLPLTQRSGGPVAVKPSPGGRLLPLSQQYLVGVAVGHPDAAVYPGNMARVSIGCRWRTCAWWLWTTMSATFDLGLL